MKDTLSYICEGILLLLIVAHFLRAFFSENKSKIWSPISVVSLTYLYYCSIPFWIGTIEIYFIDETMYNGYLFHIATLLSYISILVGFSVKTNANFRNWNSYFTMDNANKYGIILFLVGTICYSLFRGFHFSIASSDMNYMVTNGLQFYFICMNNLFAIAGGLLIVKLKKTPKYFWAYLLIWLIYVQIIFAGVRWLIIVVLVTMLTTYYLYPYPKKINIPFMLSLIIVVYLGFSIMDKSRQRNAGIDMKVAMSLSYDEIKDGAQENYSVYFFSLRAMDWIDQTGERVYFTPIIAAALMPIPRFLLSWKPDAGYLKKIEDGVFGKDEGGGAAFLNFVEYYMAFGWIGIIVMCYIIGWISKMFWDNYQRNNRSIGAILALGAFSAVLYSVISRGYLAGTLPNVLFVVFLPFWLTALIRNK